MKKNHNKISIIIPTFNEEGSIKLLVERVHAAFGKNKSRYEIIFVDDNSTDRTRNEIRRQSSRYQKNLLPGVVSKLAALYPIKLHIKDGKKGKAFSIYEGLGFAKYDAIAMIDADLQYPPEAIPSMLEKLSRVDIIVANRRDYRETSVRKLFSKVFKYSFGHKLFGLKHDIQSGLKVFKKSVFEATKFSPSSAWTFDLEFLHRASQAGFTIENFDITFEKRKNGNSKIGFAKQTLEIGFNALKVRTKRIDPVHISPSNGSMLGAGVGYKRKRYITHTTLPHHTTALKTITTLQKSIILFVILHIAVGLYFQPLLTLQLLVAVLSFIYFVDVLFNLYLIGKSLTSESQITSSERELKNINDSSLPIYTILCPLYRESHVITQFLDAIGKIDWPKSRLDVILLLEEDDSVSIDAVKKMSLPSYVRTLIVPDGVPKTKPKACNYGLAHAKGEYVVIYDAEDMPDPLQLKKAYLGFSKVGDDVICLQAKLNYYNPHQNLLTRAFTAEYSLWFDVTLTGLQAIETTIPLGGTSNHFKMRSLREVEGWDPFNVTEDADLGVRLFRKGYKTSMIDSVTLEEANSRFGNWLRQRSRWIKGYMQTYLVHTRNTSAFKGRPQHSLIFQLIVGGKIAFVLINPILWVATISYFTLYAYVGPQIEALYPSVVFYMALFSFVFGNFMFLYYYMIGVAKKGQWELMKYIFLIPFYWIAISIAACIALCQLIFKPHYWEKTVHGLHLAATPKKSFEAEPTRRRFSISIPSISLGKNFAGGALIIATGIGSIFNFLYIAYLGRVLTLESFALISFFGGMYSFISIIAGTLGTTVGYKTGFLLGKYGENHAFSFWKIIRGKFIFISIFASILWVAATPFMTQFFKIESIFPILLFAPILLVSLAYWADRGFLTSRLSFLLLAVLVVAEPIIKFVVSVLFVYFNLGEEAYIAIPISIIIAFLMGWIFVLLGKRREKVEDNKEVRSFPFKFMLGALATGVSSVIFLNLDVILAKHYLSAEDAGLYSLAALTGKIIFLLGSLGIPFILPLVSRNEGAKKDSRAILRLTLVGTLAVLIPSFVALGVFGRFTAPFLFGDKAITVVPYLLPICFSMVCFSISRIYADYYLAKKYYTFAALGILLGAIQVALLSIFHSSVALVVIVMCGIWITHFILTITLHMLAAQVKIFENNVADFLDLFTKLRPESVGSTGATRILIFNWRDVRHTWAGGAEVYIQELAKRMVKEGSRVTLFCGRSNGEAKNEVIDGVQIYRRGGFYTVYAWAFLYYIFKFRSRYDVIIDSENGIPFFTPLYTSQKKFLLIHHVHQEVFRKSLRWPLANIASVLEAKLMPLVYRNTQVITVSPSSKEEIMKHKLTRGEPLIIYNGVDLTRFIRGQKSTKPLVLYVGRLQYYKSLHVFIIAAKRILKKIPETEFIIAGEGGEKKKLQEFAKKLGVFEKITFLGKVTEEEKINLFQKAWVFVNPSFIEGWGITTIEAAATGTPAVASDVAGLRDSIKHNYTGLLIKYGSYQGFTKAILQLILDRKLRLEMSRNAVEWANYFSWDKSAQELYALISRVEARQSKAFSFEKLSYILNKFTSLF